ncbi:Heterodimeric geranylgeranyl pyrophosphate synthase small subunit [Nymphaea thermarum]|nr:Heterodimeric geranylgeranyl pyrophosphate synthase small subunit [Nymphaea thermarum]
MSAYLQAAISSSSSKVADIIDRDPFRYTVLSTPVSLATLLCVAASELVSGQREPALPTACGLHIMHAALEAHRRMPALFDVPVQLGRASTHLAFGCNFALLASDALMPLAYQQVATAGAHLGNRALRVVVEFAKAAGSQGMVGGLYYELRDALPTPPPSMAAASADDHAFEQVGGAVMEKKSSLIGCGCACGGIVGGGSEEEIESLRRYGKYVGMLQEALKCVEEEEIKLRGSSESACSERDKALEVAEELRGRAVKKLAAFDEAAGLYGLVHGSLDHVAWSGLTASSLATASPLPSLASRSSKQQASSSSRRSPFPRSRSPLFPHSPLAAASSRNEEEEEEAWGRRPPECCWGRRLASSSLSRLLLLAAASSHRRTTPEGRPTYEDPLRFRASPKRVLGSPVFRRCLVAASPHTRSTVSKLSGLCSMRASGNGEKARRWVAAGARKKTKKTQEDGRVLPEFADAEEVAFLHNKSAMGTPKRDGTMAGRRLVGGQLFLFQILKIVVHHVVKGRATDISNIE